MCGFRFRSLLVSSAVGRTHVNEASRRRREKTSGTQGKLDIAHLRNFRVHQFRFYINTSDAVGEWDPSHNDHLNRTNF